MLGTQCPPRGHPNYSPAALSEEGRAWSAAISPEKCGKAHGEADKPTHWRGLPGSLTRSQ